MGIVRNSVKCDGCGATINLRLGVGLDQEQPFFCICAKCNAAVRGKLFLTALGSTRLELDGGEVTREVPGTYQVVTLHPDLPAKTNADTLDGLGGGVDPVV